MMRERTPGFDRTPPAACRLRLWGAVAVAALLAAGCGGSVAPADAAGEPAAAMETDVEGLALPRDAQRIQVVADDDQRSITHYSIQGAEVDDIVDFHLDRLPDAGWEEDEDRRADTELAGQPAVRLQFGREPWQPRDGVESLRYRLTVEVVEDGDDVRLIWTVVDQQAVRGGS